MIENQKKISVNGEFIVSNLYYFIRGQVTIILHPYGASKDHQKRKRLRKVIPCREDGMRQFRELNTETHIRLSKGGYQIGEMGTHDNDCFICLDSWSYWLSPFNWSNNVWTSTRIVIIVIAILSSFCFICLFVKICSCFKWCCCSSWRTFFSCQVWHFQLW